jgi:hypothetical protein
MMHARHTPSLIVLLQLKHSVIRSASSCSITRSRCFSVSGMKSALLTLISSSGVLTRAWAASFEIDAFFFHASARVSKEGMQLTNGLDDRYAAP